MACLTYAPSKVELDKLTYTREELIAAKQILMDYCLGQLRHLNLGDVEQPNIKKTIDQMCEDGFTIDPKHVPSLQNQTLRNTLLQLQKQGSRPFIPDEMSQSRTLKLKTKQSFEIGRNIEGDKKRPFLNSVMESTDFDSIQNSRRSASVRYNEEPTDESTDVPRSSIKRDNHNVSVGLQGLRSPT